jgi:hypothetical protein
MEYLEVSSYDFNKVNNLDNWEPDHLKGKRKKRKAAKRARKQAAPMVQPQDVQDTPLPSESLPVPEGMPKEVAETMPQPMLNAMTSTDMSAGYPRPREEAEAEQQEAPTSEDSESYDHADKKKKKKHKFLHGLLAVATGGASLAVDKQGRKMAATDLKNAAKAAVSLAKNLNPMFLPLMPLRPLMRKALAKAGHPVSKKINITDLANQFYQYVVKPTKHYQGEGAFYDEPDLNMLDTPDDNIVEAAVSGIITGILDFIKGIKNKAASGQKLSPLEADIANGTAKVEGLLASKAKEQARTTAANTIGTKILFDNKTHWIIAGVVLAIIVVTIIIIKKK